MAKDFVNSDAFGKVGGALASSGIIDAGDLESIKNKVSDFDPSAAMSTNPKQILANMKDMTEIIKQKALKKLEEECVRRGIGVNMVGIMLAAIT